MSNAAALEAALAPANCATPILWCHGTDDRTVEFACGQAGHEALERLGVDVQFRAFPGLAHSACPAEFDQLGDFLEQRFASC